VRYLKSICEFKQDELMLFEVTDFLRRADVSLVDMCGVESQPYTI